MLVLFPAWPWPGAAPSDCWGKKWPTKLGVCFFPKYSYHTLTYKNGAMPVCQDAEFLGSTQ